MKVGCLVTRYKYNHDVVFKVEKINKDIAVLTGEYVRLRADAPLSDLKLYENEDLIMDESVELEFNRNSKLINGCVLHLDGDERYLKKCLDVYKKSPRAVNFYKKNGFKIVGETKAKIFSEFIMEKSV
jgi:spore coat assembly protein